MYDFIIFNASDIKDLIVCEQPKADSRKKNAIVASNLFYDPAIVSISKNPPPEPMLPPKLDMMMNTATVMAVEGIKKTAGGVNGVEGIFTVLYNAHKRKKKQGNHLVSPLNNSMVIVQSQCDPTIDFQIFNPTNNNSITDQNIPAYPMLKMVNHNRLI